MPFVLKLQCIYDSFNFFVINRFTYLVKSIQRTQDKETFAIQAATLTVKVKTFSFDIFKGKCTICMSSVIHPKQLPK